MRVDSFLNRRAETLVRSGRLFLDPLSFSVLSDRSGGRFAGTTLNHASSLAFLPNNRDLLVPLSVLLMDIYLPTSVPVLFQFHLVFRTTAIRFTSAPP